MPAALEAMRVLTDPAETGAVTLALPEDVQTEAFEVPDAFLEPRVWTVFRQPPAPEALARAAELIRAARRPLIVAGGGVIYAEATAALRALVDATGHPGRRDAGGPRRAASPTTRSALGAIGATGTPAANRLARDADLVIGVGTRWSDFTTASKSAFQDPGVRFVNINVAGFDAAKHSGLALVADARLALDALRDALAGHRVDEALVARGPPRSPPRGPRRSRALVSRRPTLPRPSQARGDRRGQRRRRAEPTSSSAPPARCPATCTSCGGRAIPTQGYHVEYGYSCMGYEIPGGMGVKLAAPEREVFVMIGDGSYLMLPGELATAVASGIKLVVVLVDNHGYASIGALSRSVGDPVRHQIRRRRRRPSTRRRANAESLGARVVARASAHDSRSSAPRWRKPRRPTGRSSCTSRSTATPACRATRAGGTCRSPRSPPRPSVQEAREEYERARRAQRQYVDAP